MVSRDPRETITPESFAIDPNLLGLPLARPGRRAAAMAIDLVLVALLVNAGSVLFGFAAAWVFFRISGKSAGGGLLLRSWRLAFRSLAAVVLFATVVSLWGTWRRSEPSPAPRQEVALAELEALPLGEDLSLFREAQSAEEGTVAAERLASGLWELGFDNREIRSLLETLGREEGRPWAAEAANVVTTRGAVRQRRRATSALAADSLLDAYTAALAAGDSSAMDSVRTALGGVVAADTVGVLQAQVHRLERRANQLHVEAEAAREERGILSFARVAADDLGLSLGWMGLYFTAFLALWQGQTPGKRLLRIRVVRLDGKPMGWWGAFERFGGYAASLVTGLLGFIQIVWDRNRQGMHDKITETVVVKL